MSPVSLPAQAVGYVDPAELCEILRQVNVYRSDKKVPKELLKRRAPLVRGGYDPNAVLQLFPRLRLATGQVLDFVYDFQELGGHPIVYARGQNSPAFAGIIPYKQAYPRSYFLGGSIRFDPAYLAAVQTDGTPAGFMQLALHVLIGEQFFIHWHAAYSLCHPILTAEHLEDVMQVLTPDERKSAVGIDVTPTVTFASGTVSCQYVVFNDWQGLKRITWTVRTQSPAHDPPYALAGVVEKVLVLHKNPMRF